MAHVDSLIQELKSHDLTARQSAAQQLAQMEEEARPAAVTLVRAVATEDETLREWVVGALESLGPPLTTDAEPLSTLLTEDQLDVAYWAATLLGRLSKDASTAVPNLVTALKSHPEMAVRERAAWALGQIGNPAASAKEALQAAAASDNARLAKVSKAALARI